MLSDDIGSIRRDEDDNRQTGFHEFLQLLEPRDMVGNGGSIEIHIRSDDGETHFFDDNILFSIISLSKFRKMN